MTKLHFSVSDIIQNSWDKFKSEPFFWIALTIINLFLGFLVILVSMLMLKVLKQILILLDC